MHEIDLEKYEIRTDMLVDLTDEDKKQYKQDVSYKDGIKISWLNLDSENKLNKPAGNYLTLEFEDVTDTDNLNKVQMVFKEELLKMLDLLGYDKTKKTCVIGLGNKNSTPDSLGPLVADKIIVTKHLFDMNESVDQRFSYVSAFYPGVTGQTGIETSDFIKAVVDKTKPDFVIVIDALSSSSISRVNKSIQVTDSGITPGSGVGNKRKEISENTLGVPVVAIGVPTVTSATVIVADTINYMIKNFAYNKKLSDKKINKFINKPVNYLKKDVDITNDDKKTFLGLVGTLSFDELSKLVYEVLTPIGYNLMVAPKEVDFVIDKLSDLISFAVNNTIHDI